jgi:hypothetical protein
MSERGVNISARGQSWTDGRRDQLEGQKLVEESADRTGDGERDLKKALAAVTRAERHIEDAKAGRANGEQLISNGTLKMQKAEADYAAIRNGPPAIPGQ